jgi:hypothetical protein
MIPGPRCSVGALLGDLPITDSVAVREALANDGVSASSLSQALLAHGVRIMPQTIRRHRNDLCACPIRAGFGPIVASATLRETLSGLIPE